VGREWRNFGSAGAESRTVGGDPDENCLSLTRTGEMGVQWCRFRGQKGDSCSDEIGISEVFAGVSKELTGVASEIIRVFGSYG
jgi:hypothetical protein